MSLLLKNAFEVGAVLKAPKTNLFKYVRFIVTDLQPKDTPTIGSPTDDKLKKINFPPFMKGVFAGDFNKSILSYAEVLNYEKYYILKEQTRQLTEFLRRNEESLRTINERGTVPEAVLTKMKSMDLNGLLVPEQYGGANLMNTEALRLFQELGADLSLSELLTVNELMCTKAIVKHGSIEQKNQYLPAISSGDLWTGFCLAEDKAGSDPNSVEAKAVFDSVKESYTLTGRKTWVTNGLKAGVFLVFAKLNARNYLGEDEDLLTAFLVDRSTPGVEVSQPHDLAALNGLQVCDVQFDCVLTPANLLGSPGMGLQVLNTINHENKYFMVAGIVTRLRNLLNKTVMHTLERKQYGSKLSEFQLIKLQIAKCSTLIYALESMLYITSGLADVGINPDIEVESAIVKQFAADSFSKVTQQCLSILGAATNMKGSVYQEILAESNALQSWQGSSNIIKCFIAISGILHIVETKGEHLKQCRSPGLHPFKSLKFSLNKQRQLQNILPKKLMLEHHVHPRLALAAERVDCAARRLALCSEQLLMADGFNVQVKEANLERISDIATETYAMVCTLARASRSYVVGHAHANHEITLAIPFIFDSHRRVEARVQEIMTEDGHRDEFYEKASEYIASEGGYCAVHPITKNSF